MKLSDYVAQFLQKQGICHVFAISGGASVHLIQSIADTDGIDFVCPQHEQAGAMAADGYARMAGLGAAISTSGPGATNMVTGVAGAYYDSIPVIYITGQVNLSRIVRDSGVRQLGFQETATVDIYKPITKYAVLIDDSKMIRYELEKAAHIALSGRQGPVLIDIPDDIQRAEIEPNELRLFSPRRELSPLPSVDKCIELISQAERPVVILGWGVSRARAEAKELVDRLGFPVASTWAVMDMFPSSYPLLVGGFGTHGTRHGNFAVQSADLILAIGTKLDSHARGGDIKTFAPHAKKIVVDIDQYELAKYARLGLEVDVLIHADAKSFLQAMNQAEIKTQDIMAWKARIQQWKKRYPIGKKIRRAVDPYAFVKSLSSLLSDGEIIVSDTGSALAWLMQAFRFKENQRLIHDWNNTAMGWALPASTGAHLATGKRIICVTGDGALQMNIQELATVIRHQFPIKIFLINNRGYTMLRQTQDEWLNSRYLASSIEGGLAFPDFIKVARAYGFGTFTIGVGADMVSKIEKVLSTDGPAFCNVEISPEHRVVPQLKYGRPIHDAEPLLSRDEFEENVIA